MVQDTYICGIFYTEQPGEESEYLNMKGKSSSCEFQEVYWKSLIVFFSTAHRTNPEAKLKLFSNSTPPYSKWSELLSNIGVEIIDIPYAHKPRKGHWKAWQSTFYIIDCLGYLRKKVKNNDYVYFMDIDCVVVKSLKKLNSIMEKYGILNYSIDYPVNHKVHGISREDMKREFNSLDSYPIYFGGEIYGFYGQENVELIYNESSNILRKNFSDKTLTFNTEEHLFTFLFWKLDKAYDNGKGYIKRIWTDASNFRNVSMEDLSLTVWHLPAEKNKGLKKLFNELTAKGNKFWNVNIEQYPEFLGGFLSVPKRNLNRFVVEGVKIVIKKVLSKLNRK